MSTKLFSKNKFLILLPTFFLLGVFLVKPVYAGTATVSWNVNTEPDLASYKIYYGTSARIGTDPKTCGLCGYSASINVGKVTTYAFSSLTDGLTYYFSVSAIDTSTNESSFSAQVSKILPSATYITNLNFTPSCEGTSASSKTFTITVYQATTQVAQFSVQPNAQGQIPLPSGTNLLSGTYNITADASYYLKARQNSISLASNSTVALTILKAGDLNNDGIINSLDWSEMNSNWWSNSYPSDINQDGVVNSIDFSWMNKNWLSADA